MKNLISLYKMYKPCRIPVYMSLGMRATCTDFCLQGDGGSGRSPKSHNRIIRIGGTGRKVLQYQCQCKDA